MELRTSPRFVSRVRPWRAGSGRCDRSRPTPLRRCRLHNSARRAGMSAASFQSRHDVTPHWRRKHERIPAAGTTQPVPLAACRAGGAVRRSLSNGLICQQFIARVFRVSLSEVLVMSLFDKFSLRGKVAIVTGGNRGIGKAIALGFAEAGAVVAVVARDEKKNEDTLAELRGMGANAIALTANVAERSDLEAMLRTVTDELGPVDVLVNNAGIGFHEIGRAS